MKAFAFEHAVIGPTEYVLPRTRVTNDEWARGRPDWDMARTARRTGVESRGIAGPGESARSMGALAARSVLERHDVGAESVGALLVCTQTPDYPLPPNSTLIHAELGLRESAPAFDITHACSGFVYAAGIAQALLRGTVDGPVLVVTGDTYSRLIDPDDRSTRTVFGDGAAATIIDGAASGRVWQNGIRIRGERYGTRGKDHERFIVKSGGAAQPDGAPVITMDGLGMLQFVTSVIPGAVEGLVGDMGWGMDEVDVFVFHQASRVALDALRSGLSVEPERVYECMADTGNLVSASIPVCLGRAAEAGRLRGGDKVVLAGFGVGLSWGVIAGEVVEA